MCLENTFCLGEQTNNVTEQKTRVHVEYLFKMVFSLYKITLRINH